MDFEAGSIGCCILAATIYQTILHAGFPSVDAYYAGSSSALSIPNVAIPLLCVQADNDPIAPKEAIPYDAIAANPNTALVVTPTGGHLGWMAGRDGALGTLCWEAIYVVAGKDMLRGNNTCLCVYESAHAVKDLSSTAYAPSPTDDCHRCPMDG